MHDEVHQFETHGNVAAAERINEFLTMHPGAKVKSIVPIEIGFNGRPIQPGVMVVFEVPE